MATGLYDLLSYHRTDPLGTGGWLGNLRWYAQEDDKPLSYTFITIPVEENDGQLSHNGPESLLTKRILFNLAIGKREDIRGDIGEYSGIRNCGYHPDYLSVSTYEFKMKLYLPWQRYGAIFLFESYQELEEILVSFNNSLKCGRESLDMALPELVFENNKVICRDGRYNIIFKYNCEIRVLDNNSVQFVLNRKTQTKITVSYHIDKDKADMEADFMLNKTDKAIEESKDFWEQYLQSCPTVKFESDYSYHNEFLDRDIAFSHEEILKRQLWHWWSLPVNVYNIEFNDFPIYISPEKNSWHGIWSNDGAETLCALSLTSEWKLARGCILSHISTGINKDGVLSWYINGCGNACYDRVGNCGRFSHGVPNIVHTMDFYIRATGDYSILDEIAGDNLTVWEKLSRYILCVFTQRDINQDGLIEWSNLWETGWDDKVSPFFSKADLKEWVNTVVNGSDEDIKLFYSENCYPVTSIVEQCYFLWALESMMKLSSYRKDAMVLEFCEKKYKHILEVVANRHWNEETGFYYDWDVRNDCLCESKNMDAFYFMYFEKDLNRLDRLMEHFNNVNEFNLPYIPTLSMDSKGFRAEGYWSGGSWPRESSYLGLALHQSGFKEKALETVIRALCSQEGNIIAECINPFTGANTTRHTTIAYSSMLNVVLQKITGQLEW